MSVFRDALRGALERVAGALNKLTAPARGTEVGTAGAKRTEIGPAGVESDESALLDRERQLRVLMSSWM
jgi:hypothetical protein